MLSVSLQFALIAAAALLPLGLSFPVFPPADRAGQPGASCCARGPRGTDVTRVGCPGIRRSSGFDRLYFTLYVKRASSCSSDGDGGWDDFGSYIVNADSLLDIGKSVWYLHQPGMLRQLLGDRYERAKLRLCKRGALTVPLPPIVNWSCGVDMLGDSNPDGSIPALSSSVLKDGPEIHARLSQDAPSERRRKLLSLVESTEASYAVETPLRQVAAPKGRAATVLPFLEPKYHLVGE